MSSIQYDSMMQRLQIEVVNVGKDGITVCGNMRQEFYNIYGIAHGGYLYTLGHMAAQLSGQICLGGDWEVSEASCQYLNPLRVAPARAETELVGMTGTAPVYRVQVFDAQDKLCFEEMATLHPAEPATEVFVQEPKLSCLAPKAGERVTFAKFLHVYETAREETRVVYTADLCGENCDASGVLHSSAMFTAADAATSGSLFHVQGKDPITVSASIYYFQNAVVGPVSAVPKLIRSGRVLHYYDVDIMDGVGTVVASAQFIIQDLGHK